MVQVHQSDHIFREFHQNGWFFKLKTCISKMTVLVKSAFKKGTQFSKVSPFKKCFLWIALYLPRSDWKLCPRRDGLYVYPLATGKLVYCQQKRGASRIPSAPKSPTRCRTISDKAQVVRASFSSFDWLSSNERHWQVIDWLDRLWLSLIVHHWAKDAKTTLCINLH